MSKVRVAAVQMSCSTNVEESIANADTLVRAAAEEGAKIILLPELFERQYFCQERRYDYYEYATSLEENPAVNHFKAVAEELGIVIPVSFYERDVNVLYNSVAMIDNYGEIIGLYRKTHIPDDHFYQEKFYFTPGDTGFEVFETDFGKIGIGICWDQWFPETARSLALLGADIILYPTAIGKEPILEVDSMEHWRRTMQGHSAANIIPVVAANRVGSEKVTPCKENNNQESELVFYGSSFMTDQWGALVTSADRESEGVICADYDFDVNREDRLSWGVFRDRRPEMYTDLL
ncbi:N-carbamoylputrescine amidase [Oscillospiraceae bacterium]|nr:N-carbamoylputrescine amidase [Oscillospiraceae bacterium]